MKKISKLLSLVLAMLLVIGLLGGCKAKSTEEANKPDTTNNTEKKEEVKKEPVKEEVIQKDPVKLVMWGGVPGESGPDMVVEAFNKLDPNVQIEYVRYVNDDSGNTNLELSLMSGEAIDIYISYGDGAAERRAQNGLAMDMMELAANAGFSLADHYGDAVAKTLTKDGKLFYVKGNMSNQVILYNQKMFDEAGVPYPRVGWTYDEFESALEKLTKGEGQAKVYGYYMSGWGQETSLNLAATKLGADIFYTEDGKASNFDHPDVKASLEKYLDRVEKGYEPSFGDNVTEKMTPQDMLLNGRAAMVHGGWIVRNVKNTDEYPHDFKVGFATLPKLTNDQDKLYLSSLGDNMSISAASAHPQEAMEFIKWYVEEGCKDMIPFGRFPASKMFDKDVAEALFLDGAEDLFDKESTRNVLLGNFDARIQNYATALPEISVIANEEFEKAYFKIQTVEDTLKRAKERADAEIKKALSN